VGTLKEKCSIITRSGGQGTGTLTLKWKKNVFGDRKMILALHNVEFKDPVSNSQAVKIRLSDGRELIIDNVSWIPLTFFRERNAPDRYCSLFNFTRDFEIK